MTTSPPPTPDYDEAALEAWSDLGEDGRCALIEAICFVVIEAAPDPNAEEATATPIDLATHPMLEDYSVEAVGWGLSTLDGAWLSAVAGRPVTISATLPTTVYV